MLLFLPTKIHDYFIRMSIKEKNYGFTGKKIPDKPMSSFYATALHRTMQYISIGSCSIYPSAVAVYIQPPMQYILLFVCNNITLHEQGDNQHHSDMILYLQTTSLSPVQFICGRLSG